MLKSTHSSPDIGAPRVPPQVDAADAPLSPSDGDAVETPASSRLAGASVRPLEARDLGAVAALFVATFRKAGGAVPQSLPAYFAEVFLHHPWADAATPSRVHVAANGRVDGFIGVLPARMTLAGRPIRAAIAGSLMVADSQRDPLAGARLIRAFLKGPQDLSFSETANPLSHGMWEKLGGVAAPAYSMEWLRVFKPLTAVAAAAAEKVSAVRIAVPVARGLDRLAAPLARHVAGPITPVANAADADEEALAAALPALAAAVPLAPTWDDETALRWLLAHARRKERHGPAHIRVVRDRAGNVAGASIYFGRPGGIAWVLQMIAKPQAAAQVVDDLFATASAQGFAAVRGRTDPVFLDALMRRRCLMLHRASTVLHSRDRDILDAIRRGDAMLTGLAGETWMRLIGGEFV